MPDPFQCRCGHRLPPESFAGGMAAWCPKCGWPVAPPTGPVSARKVAKPLDLPPPAPPPPPPSSRRLRVRDEVPVRRERDDRDDEPDDFLPPARRSLWDPEYVRPLMIGGTLLFLAGVALCGGLLYVLDPFAEKPVGSPPVAVAPPVPPPPTPPPTERPKTATKQPLPGDDWPTGKAKSPTPGDDWPTATPKKQKKAPPAPKPKPSKGYPPKWTDRPPAEVMIGDWVADLGATLRSKRDEWKVAKLRFEADGRFRSVVPGGEFVGRWAVVQVSGRIVYFRLTADDPAKQPRADLEFSVSFLSDDHLEFAAKVARDLDAPQNVDGKFRRPDAVSIAGPDEP